MHNTHWELIIRRSNLFPSDMANSCGNSLKWNGVHSNLSNYIPRAANRSDDLPTFQSQQYNLSLSLALNAIHAPQSVCVRVLRSRFLPLYPQTIAYTRRRYYPGERECIHSAKNKKGHQLNTISAESRSYPRVVKSMHYLPFSWHESRLRCCCTFLFARGIFPAAARAPVRGLVTRVYSYVLPVL